MAFNDMREWMAKLESLGQLKRITTKVDWNLEIAEIARRSIQEKGPAILFENIKDHEHTRCTKLFVNGLTRRNRIALMLGLPEDTPREAMVKEVKKRYRQGVAPVRVKTGPVKENIVKGNDIDLFQFPVVKWHPLDGGRYIDNFCGVVTKDPETGQLNVGLYRGMVIAKNKISKYMIPHQHWGQHYLKYQQRGEPMPIAMVYGWDDVLPFVAGSPMAHPPTEYEVMGSLRQKPVELIKCETSDIEVPASAEIVIEGTISPDPGDFENEGPFGEWPGFYGWTRKRPVVKVNCITHRNDPILRGQAEGMKPGVISEGGYIGLYSHAALLLNYLESAGVPGIMDIIPAPWVVVKLHKTYEGQARQVASAIWGSCLGLEFDKVIMVVDEDVDIYNLRALQLAIRDKIDPADGLVVWPNAQGYTLDPAIPWELRDEFKYGGAPQNKLLIDATVNWVKHPIRPEWGNQRYPPPCADMLPEIENLVTKRWKEYGF